jgi:hypothetical protein
MLDAMCNKNEQGQICLDVFAAFAKTIATKPKPTSCSTYVKGSCPAACKSEVQSTLSPLGCCFASLMTVMSDGDTDDGVTMFKDCGVDPQPCSAPKTSVTVMIKVPGLLYSWCSANIATCTSRLKNDIAAAAYVKPDSVTITVSKIN